MAVAVFAVVVVAGGRRSPEPFPALAVAAEGLASIAIVGALQSRLLRGHVRAPGLWLVIALIDGVFFVLSLVYRTGGASTVQPTGGWDYVRIGLAALVVAVAQWWFVLRPDVPRATLWVPIAVIAWGVPFVFAVVGQNALSSWALALLPPIVGATGMVYLLGDDAAGAPPAPASS